MVILRSEPSSVTARFATAGVFIHARIDATLFQTPAHNGASNGIAKSIGLN